MKVHKQEDGMLCVEFNPEEIEALKKVFKKGVAIRDVDFTKEE